MNAVKIIKIVLLEKVRFGEVGRPAYFLIFIALQ
jgi:hypothetical protein